MSAELLLHRAPDLPEWRRSGWFFALAAILHGAVLAYPLQHILLEAVPLPPLAVTLVPPQPAITPPPLQPTAPVARPEKQPPRSRQPLQRTPPILAMAPEQQAPAPSTPVVAPATMPDPAPRPAAVATPAPAAPAPIVAARYNAAYLNNPSPKYPPMSRRLGEEGKVLLRVRVTADGVAAAVDLEKSSNFERLDEAARQTVARWRFVPAKRGEEAIEASVIVPIIFRLDS